MSRAKENFLEQLKNKLLEIDEIKHVSRQFVYFEEFGNNLPAILLIDGREDIDESIKPFVEYTASILLFIKETENISTILNNIQQKIINKIHGKKINNYPVSITLVDNNNIFSPLGFDAGVFPPYGAVRLEIISHYTWELER